MLYEWLYPLAEHFTLFNLFKYITFRSAGAFFTAMTLTFWMGPSVIAWLKSKQGEGQPIREDGPESHLLTKKGTPTMGGLMMLIPITISCMLWGVLDNGYLWLVLGVTLIYGLIGFYDDYLKLTKRNTKGLTGRQKLLLQFMIAGLVGLAVHQWSDPALRGAVAVPFFKNVLIPMGWAFVGFAAIVIVGSSNAVNLTDGLDGLATVPVMIVAGTFALFAYLVGNAVFAEYLQLHYVAGSGELVVFCAALIGAGLGFLWYNAPPAMVFMGDTGSLALGGALGAISVIIKHELVLLIAGGLFVAEAVSVILQVFSFKTTGKRIFRMAPLHHHFEKKGWQEPTVVIRFWIISVILALIALTTLKLR